MFTVATVLNALELGFIYALVAMALFLSFRVLNIADMTTDGAFTLGCAVSATAAVAGHPFLGLPLAMLAGAAAGFITAFLQTKLAVPSRPPPLWRATRFWGCRWPCWPVLPQALSRRFCRRGWQCPPFWRASSPTRGCTR